MNRIIKSITKIWHRVITTVAPPKCIICSRLLRNDGALCERCLKIYAKLERKRCPICRKQAKNCTCRPMSLMETDSIGDRIMIASAFLSPPDSIDVTDKLIRKIVYHIKRNEDRSGIPFASRVLSHEVNKVLQENRLDKSSFIITSPPRSKSEKLKYGFDHAKELALKISEYTGIPYVNCFNRHSHKMQKSLNAHERRANADASYTLRDMSSKHIENVLIVDDVITTGATINACSRLLKRAGASIVFPICIARTKKRIPKLRKALNSAPWFNSKKMKIKYNL